jgi:hypothetical protein
MQYFRNTNSKTHQRLIIMKQIRNSKPIILLFSLPLLACSQSAQDPKIVADKYWQNILVGNTVEAEKQVSVNSRYTFSEIKDRMTPITQVTNGDAETIIRTTVTAVGPDKVKQAQSFDTVLVLEQGQWKVDVNRSQIPPLQDVEHDSDTADSFESIDRALNDSMEKLNEAIREGSKEMGDSFLRLMDDLNNSMQESIEQLKRYRQENRQPAQPDNQPRPEAGEGMI